MKEMLDTTGCMVSVHPFGLNSATGGSKILRTLFADAPLQIRVVNTCLYPESEPSANEIQIPPRPYFGRIENTRLNKYFTLLDAPFEKSFFENLSTEIKRLSPTIIHAIPQDTSFWQAFQCSRALKIPFVLNVHDDMQYTFASLSHARKEQTMAHLGEVWRNAETRFVISEEMGNEYSRRYGSRPFAMVTDGFQQYLPVRQANHRRLFIYFMGLFHVSYDENLNCLLSAIEILESRGVHTVTRLQFRCGILPRSVRDPKSSVELLPMATTGVDLIAECAAADLVYLPLQFGAEYADFFKLSLSTKMVSYIASGTPILYHGPDSAAASKLLGQFNAAIQATSLDPQKLADQLESFINGKLELSQDGRESLQKRFLAVNMQSKFWQGVNKTVFGITTDIS